MQSEKTVHIFIIFLSSIFFYILRFTDSMYFVSAFHVHVVFNLISLVSCI